MATTLVVTNDFPPRIGGIESFVSDACDLLDHDVVVYTSQTRGSGLVDRGLPFEVVRAGPVLVPTPQVSREAVRILRRSGATRVLFGAAAPLGLLARPLRAAGVERIVALSHGHETWWATVPGARSLLRRLADDVDHLSTISDFAAGRIARALSPEARKRMIRLPPPVDTEIFRPPAVRRDHTVDRPRCVSVARLVPRKGMDTLLRAWRLVTRRWPAGRPTPELVIVGSGGERGRLEAMVTAWDLRSSVRLVGAQSRLKVRDHLQRADVFALPVRTRLAGLNPEGLGLVFVEAAACGLPVIVGDSGGAPETVLHNQTGFVVDPRDPDVLAGLVTRLLTDHDLARSMGAAGRRYVTASYGHDRARATLRTALGLD